MQTSNTQARLDEAIANLPQEKMPNRDLWKGIELAIESDGLSLDSTNTTLTSSKRGTSFWIASAASFALIAMIGWTGWQGLAGNNALFVNDRNSQNNDSLNGELLNDSVALVNALSAQHESNVNALLVEFEGQEPVTENWQKQLSELDAAAEAIKVALKEDPANTALLGMLQTVYQKQIDLIERVHAPRWQQI